MYIWMILAMFIVSLATFNLSSRSDLPRQQQVPLAEAALTKFLVQHDAAVKYAKNHSLSSLVTGSDLKTTLENYYPVGYKPDSHYKSEVYCLNLERQIEDPETGDVTTIQEGTEQVDCSDTETPKAAYVITYGNVPDRWVNVATGKVLGDFYAAMRRKVAAGSSCGIVEQTSNSEAANNLLGTTFVIHGVSPANVSIPRYFLSDSGSDGVIVDGADGCSGINGINAKPCIVYVTSL